MLEKKGVCGGSRVHASIHIHANCNVPEIIPVRWCCSCDLYVQASSK